MPALLPNIATLIAAEMLDSGIISEASDRLRNGGLNVDDAEWVEQGRAIDLAFDGDLDAARTALSGLQQAVDVCVQPRANRRKMLLVSDMDSTMITVECIDELADYAGIKAQIAEVTERAMQGELDFSEALRARVALLAGLDEAMIARCLAERVRPMAGARPLVRTMAGWGAHCVLVSGGFTAFAGQVAADIGFHESKANILGIANAKLTGEVDGEIVDANVKRELLFAKRDEHAIDPATVLAVGDGANDIPMIAAAIEGGGLGVAYYAKPKAAAAANFAISHSDLTALLYAQGIPSRDWVRD